MNPPSDVKRAYRSELRLQQAGSTRVAVIRAASRLFAEKGYVATSVDDIAAAAGVSRATVFTAVGAKAALLKAAFDNAIVGDDEPVALVNRPRSRAVRAEPHPRRYLDGYAGIAVEIQGRLARIAEAVRGAAGADAEARSLWDSESEQRRRGAATVVADVVSKGGRLRPGVSQEAAADIVWALTDPGLYHQLVHGRGWTPARYRRWLSATLQEQLMGTIGTRLVAR